MHILFLRSSYPRFREPLFLSSDFLFSLHLVVLPKHESPMGPGLTAMPQPIKTNRPPRLTRGSNEESLEARERRFRALGGHWWGGRSRSCWFLVNSLALFGDFDWQLSWGWSYRKVSTAVQSIICIIKNKYFPPETLEL